MVGRVTSARYYEVLHVGVAVPGQTRCGGWRGADKREPPSVHLPQLFSEGTFRRPRVCASGSRQQTPASTLAYKVNNPECCPKWH